MSKITDRVYAGYRDPGHTQYEVVRVLARENGHVAIEWVSTHQGTISILTEVHFAQNSIPLHMVITDVLEEKIFIPSSCRY